MTLDPLDAFGRLVLAASLGALVGAEREWRNKSAGLRTNILITLGAALFTMMGLALSPEDGDSSRVTSQVVSGIGFLGAGAIIQGRGPTVVGLTTAATIWVNAAVGVAAGAGQYLIAAMSTGVILLVLAALNPVERLIARQRPD
jgi:putative Mg2+ transporter-C (MgtC) family protein